MKKIIYTQRVDIIESYNERRDCADQRISEFIFQCGYLPVPIPNNVLLVDEYIKEVQPFGILLTGGNSLVKYGGNAPERDDVEHALIEKAIKKKIPLYGICRGMQSILDYFQNDLENVTGHTAVRHKIKTDGTMREVNSYHNQACLRIKDNCGLEIVAQTGDGVIEAIRHKIYPILGIMWHPEREDVWCKTDMEQIRNFFNR